MLTNEKIITIGKLTGVLLLVIGIILFLGFSYMICVAGHCRSGYPLSFAGFVIAILGLINLLYYRFPSKTVGEGLGRFRNQKK